MNYKEKYLKYKNKYLNLKSRSQFGSGDCFKYGFQQHFGECWHDALVMMLFQSDKTKDLLQKLLDLNIEERTTVLKEELKYENLKDKSYKLPISLYCMYTLFSNNVTTKETSTDIIKKKLEIFFEKANIYMKSLKDRISNRMEYDGERYDSLRYLPVLPPEEAKGLLKEFFPGKNPDVMYDIIQKVPPEPEEIGIPRQFSTITSAECVTAIIDLSKEFNITKSDKITHRADILTVQLVIEIIMLYLNTDYSLQILFNIFDFNINKEFTIDYLVKIIENENLIGTNVMISNDIGAHIISLYSCDSSNILYDNELNNVIDIDWKKSLIENIKLMSEKSKLIYFQDIPIIKEMGFFIKNDESDKKIKEYIETQVKTQVDKLIEQKVPIQKESIEKNIIESYNKKSMNVTGFQFIRKINKIDNELDFILFNVIYYPGLQPELLKIFMEKVKPV